MKSIFSIGVLLFANPFTYATPLNLVAPSNRQLTSLYASSVNRPISNPSPQVWNSPPRPNPSIPASSGVAITKPNDLTQKPLRIAQDGTEPATILNWDDAVKKGKDLLNALSNAHKNPTDKSSKDKYDKYYTESLPDKKEGQSSPAYDIKPILKTLNLRQDGYTNVEVAGRPTDKVKNPKTAYDSFFDSKTGVIIAENNDRSLDPNRGDPQKELFLTDIWFQGMAKRASEAKDTLTVKYVFRHAIINQETKDIIKEAYKRAKIDLKQSHEWTFKDNQDEFAAMLATDNGKGIPRILTDYSRTLKDYNVLTLNTISNANDKGELQKPIMWFKLGTEEKSSGSPPPRPTPSSTVAPVNPPSAPRCNPTPTGHYQDAHEMVLDQAAYQFCRTYADKKIATTPKVNIVGTFNPPRREYMALGDDAKDDNYELIIKSVPGCMAIGGFNLAEPVKGHTCRDILIDAWKNCELLLVGLCSNWIDY